MASPYAYIGFPVSVITIAHVRIALKCREFCLQEVMELRERLDYQARTQSTGSCHSEVRLVAEQKAELRVLRSQVKVLKEMKWKNTGDTENQYFFCRQEHVVDLEAICGGLFPKMFFRDIGMVINLIVGVHILKIRIPVIDQCPMSGVDRPWHT